MIDERLVDLHGQLVAMIERIDEVALEVLQEASARGELERPSLDRRLLRVRRALERALVLLESP